MKAKLINIKFVLNVSHSQLAKWLYTSPQTLKKWGERRSKPPPIYEERIVRLDGLANHIHRLGNLVDRGLVQCEYCECFVTPMKLQYLKARNVVICNDCVGLL